MKYGNPKDFQWDVVSGISIGCVNSAGIALWDKGKEVEMAQWLSDTWDGLQTTDIYKSWMSIPGISMMSGFGREAFFDTTPGM